MKAKVTESGITIPPSMLPSVDEVEIRKEAGRTLIEPADREDPLCALGKEPIPVGAKNASEGHDKYIYRGTNYTPDELTEEL